MIYLDYDVLELNYDRIGAIEENIEQRFRVIDHETGVCSVAEQWSAPAPVRPFTWTAFGLSEIAAMRSFLDARKGMAVPFWLPSYQWDMTLAAPVDALDTEITVAWMKYQEQLFGTTGARRHIALWRLGVGAMQYHGIIAAECAGDRAPELLTIAPAAVSAYPTDSTVISFLKLCRLADDRVAIYYPSKGIARATIYVRELPKEIPL
jgi:hypothetical protein